MLVGFVWRMMICSFNWAAEATRGEVASVAWSSVYHLNSELFNLKRTASYLPLVLFLLLLYLLTYLPTNTLLSAQHVGRYLLRTSVTQMNKQVRHYYWY